MAEKRRLAVVHWAAATLAILGAFLIALKLPVLGCSVWIVANTLWVTWAVARKDWPTTIFFVVDEVAAIVGVINWMGA